MTIEEQSEIRGITTSAVARVIEWSQILQLSEDVSTQGTLHNKQLRKPRARCGG